jgi:hypothetical protein
MVTLLGTDGKLGSEALLEEVGHGGGCPGKIYPVSPLPRSLYFLATIK